MNFDVLIAHSVMKIEQPVWDRLCAGRPFASRRWYQYGERVRANDEPVYILLSRQGEPAALATFWVSRQEPLPISSKPLRTLVGRVFQKHPLMICRTPVIDASGLLLPTDPEVRAAAIGTIARAAQSECSRRNVSFVLFPYLEPDDAQTLAWPPEFSAVDLAVPGTRLKVIWPDFDDFIRQTPRSTRNYYKHNRNRSTDLGIQVRREEQVSAPEKALPLMRNVERHHRSAPNPWAPAMLENAGMVDATWHTAAARGRLAGCLITYKDQGSGLLGPIGLDYDVPYAYFQLVYDAIGKAIEDRCDTIWGGTGAYPFKQSLGFELTTNTWAVFAGRHRSLQNAGRYLVRWMN